MKPIKARVLKDYFSLSKDENVKIVGFSTESYKGFDGDSGIETICVVVTVEGHLYTVPLNKLIVVDIDM